MPVKQNDEPEKYGEIDPALVSANIKAGIMRGDRLHRWLTQVVDGAALPPAGELNAEEYKTAIRFIERKRCFRRLVPAGQYLYRAADIG